MSFFYLGMDPFGQNISSLGRMTERDGVTVRHGEAVRSTGCSGIVRNIAPDSLGGGIECLVCLGTTPVDFLHHGRRHVQHSASGWPAA